MLTRHRIDVESAVADFRAMLELTNEGRFSEAAPHHRRLDEMGWPQHWQPGRSLAAGRAVEAERRVAR